MSLFQILEALNEKTLPSGELDGKGVVLRYTHR